MPLQISRSLRHFHLMLWEQVQLFVVEPAAYLIHPCDCSSFDYYILLHASERAYQISKQVTGPDVFSNSSGEILLVICTHLSIKACTGPGLLPQCCSVCFAAAQRAQQRPAASAAASAADSPGGVLLWRKRPEHSGHRSVLLLWTHHRVLSTGICHASILQKPIRLSGNPGPPEVIIRSAHAAANGPV